MQHCVFTDPGIALPTRVHPGTLLFFAALLKSCPDYRTVAPHMQISDIPEEHTNSAYGRANGVVATTGMQDTFTCVLFYFLSPRCLIMSI